MHVHVESSKGEAKFWMEPVIALADYTGFSSRELTKIQSEIQEHRHAITTAWKRHFRT